MKRSILLITAIVTTMMGVCLTTSSCKKTRELRSLSKMLAEEKKNITKFISEQGFTVQEGTAEMTTFDKDVFYHLPNGLYMRVIEKGNERAEAGKTQIAVRFKGYLFNDSIRTKFDNLTQGAFQNTLFLYTDLYQQGALHYQLMPSAPGTNLNNFMCEGIAFPMSMLGNGAKISLIIPFKIGSQIAYNAGASTFCEEIRYQFYIK